MAAEVRKTNLLSKLGARVAKAHEAHKGDETKFGMVDLPPGIKNGIARLATCKLEEYKEDKPKSGIKKGELFAMFRGIALAPDKHDGVQVKGQGVMLTVPLTDTQKTKDGQVVTTSFEENWATFLNELRKLGLNTAAIPHTAVEATLASLERSKPVFRYSTRGWTPPPSATESNPKEMVFVQYDGVITEEEAAVATATSPTSGFAQPSNNGDGGHDSGTTTAAGADEGDGSIDFAEFAAKAESGDMAAIEEMKDQARNLGITEDEIENSSSWDNLANDGTSLVEMILAKASGGTSEAAPEKEPEKPAWEPKVGMTCNYQIKAGGKVHQVRVEKLDKAKKTADLLNIGDKKTKYLAVPISKLTAA